MIATIALTHEKATENTSFKNAGKDSCSEVVRPCYFLVLALNTEEMAKGKKGNPNIDFGLERSFRRERSLEYSIFLCKSFVFMIDNFSTGGWDGNAHLNSGEVYEPSIDQWSYIAFASTARWDAGIAVESDKIYIVGGCDRNALCTLETECYNPENNEWTKVASLPMAAHGLKCATIQLSHKFI